VRIAQVAPLYESVPPKLYGGTERVISYLTEELVRQGHDVTLFASGDSETQARLIAPCPRALRLDASCVDQIVHHVHLLELVAQQAGRFDLIHFHCDYLHFPLTRRLGRPHLTTLHGRLDLPDLVPLYREFAEVPLVSISNSQRRPLSWVNWQETVYHGLPPDLHAPRLGPGEYLAFLGRVSREKGIERAIEMAHRAGRPLKIAAKVDAADRTYYKEAVEPLLRASRPLVEYIGEISEAQKAEFLGNAAALLFPIDWPEPFGLVMIEALACGTPVIAWGEGSVPEIIENGVTGFVVDNLDAAVEAVARLATLSRVTCRRTFEKRFSAPRMARDYLKVYRRLAEQTPAPRGRDGYGTLSPPKAASRGRAPSLSRTPR
jgi:glycosyltransferase involved in cell wall biosynthesis